jgi:hypothetical protein
MNLIKRNKKNGKKSIVNLPKFDFDWSYFVSPSISITNGSINAGNSSSYVNINYGGTSTGYLGTYPKYWVSQRYNSYTPTWTTYQVTTLNNTTLDATYDSTHTDQYSNPANYYYRVYGSVDSSGIIQVTAPSNIAVTYNIPSLIKTVDNGNTSGINTEYMKPLYSGSLPTYWVSQRYNSYTPTWTTYQVIFATPTLVLNAPYDYIHTTSDSNPTEYYYRVYGSSDGAGTNRITGISNTVLSQF